MKYRKFIVHQLGRCPEGITLAIDMLNKVQTLWTLERSEESIPKPESSSGFNNIQSVPLGNINESYGSVFHIGVTSGDVNLDRKLSIFEPISSRALISEYEVISRNEFNPRISPVPLEVFWALALANICFRACINAECGNKNCIGYDNHKIDDLLLTMLNLEMCDTCYEKAQEYYKYQTGELKNLLNKIRRPLEYDTKYTSDLIDLPVLKNQIKRQLDLGNNTVFSPFGIVIIMHFLPDLLPFLEGLMQLGADRNHIALLVKPYPYAQRTYVHSVIYDKYKEICIEYLDDLPPDEGLLEEIVSHCRPKTNGQILIIEDGGYIVPFLHNRFSRDEDYCIGAVEQTAKGLKQDKQIKQEDFHFPVLDVAKSSFKDEYESPLVGRAVVSSIQRLLKDENFSGKKALIIGFGSIGREIAFALQALGMIVSVHDSNFSKLAAARIRGFETSDSPLKLVKDANLIIGTTGEHNGVSKEIIEEMMNGAIIASTSSDLVEIDIDYLQKNLSKSKYENGLGTYFTIDSETENKTVLLLADGYPVNFYSGEGIPNKAIDPILTQLLIGAVYVAKNHRQIPQGIQQTIMEKIINEYKLVEDFLETYKTL